MTLNTQTPNMYADYPDFGSYDLVMVNWYCEIDAQNTYWAVHQFDTNVTDGYAGFQNNGGTHFLLFAVWDHGTNYPVIEYVSDKSRIDNLTFGLEGNGKHIITDYVWEVNTWYTMCIGTKTVSGKTYYAQWIAEKDSNNWFLCGIISYPVPNKNIGSDSMFQEDFMSNNYLRKCRLQAGFARYDGTEEWERWNSYYISNAFYKYVDINTPTYNFKYDCEYGTDNDSTYLYIQSGGEDLTNPVMQPMTLPNTVTLISGWTPSNYPSWTELAPRYIKSLASNMYVCPGANNTVVQGYVPYYWIFEDSGDGYFYILNEDKTLAITISGTLCGDDLILSTFNHLDTQKWINQSVIYSEYSYFYPKNAPSMNMDIELPYSSVGAAIQLSPHDATTPSFKWLTLNQNFVYAIKSHYSNLYINPSGTEIIQSSNIYKWSFVAAGDDYFYILSPDNTKAITVSGTYDGANLAFSDYIPGNNNQKWKAVSAANNTFYFVPKCDTNKNMDIEGPVTTSGANIQIWTHTDGVSQFKWYKEL